jgi:hypothetical protein
MTNAQPNTSNGFFSSLENTKPFFKAAFEGFAGSGKTFTAALIVVGLHKHIKSSKPVVIFDTERASKFLKPLFEKAKIQVLIRESRSLADLKIAMKYCEDGTSDILFIDSLTHVYENFLEAYKEKVNRKQLQFQDWGIIKPTWKREFSDPFVNGRYHSIFTGRAAFEYDNEINEETKKREIFKSGIKMKVEGETAYEPDILVLMERFEKVLEEKKQVWREGTVLKDRSTLIDGKTFRNPSFTDFKPVISAILKDGTEKADVFEHNAADLVDTEVDKREYLKQKDIQVEKIEAFMVKNFPGQSAEAKRAKISALESCFKSSSWTEITSQSLDQLKEGYNQLHVYLEKIKAEAVEN